MDRSWKPEGYPEVSPYLVVEGAADFIDFLERAFGGTRLRRYDAPDGSVMHAEVRIGESVIMMGDAGGEWPAYPSFLHLYVEDVDAAYQRALEAGAETVQKPERKGEDPDRRGGVKDPFGNTWWLATQVE